MSVHEIVIPPQRGHATHIVRSEHGTVIVLTWPEYTEVVVYRDEGDNPMATIRVP